MRRSRLLKSGPAAVLVAALAPAPLVAETRYRIETLSGLGGAAGANSINNSGSATGTANQAGDAVSHAALWVRGSAPIDLGSFGGPDGNSAVAWPVKNNNGLVVGISDTAEDNPLGEAFSCWPFFASGTPTRKICRGFRWADGTMTALPPFPGGYNSYAAAANNRGQVVGWAETGFHDPTCNTDFQVLQFKAVIWGPQGEMQELPPLPGDSTSAATAINDKGQVVGISGACGIAVGGVSAAHAVLWENGVPYDIGSLGGHSWNTPTAINNDGTIVGFSLLAGQDGTRNYEAFIWTREGGMRSLGKPAGDVRSAAFGINDEGQVVGLSVGGPYVLRALFWENGVMTDLNDITESGSPYLLYANDINDRGEIAGQAFDPGTGELPAFVGFPIESGLSPPIASREAPKAALPESVQRLLRQRLGAILGVDE
jgi:probable HAF family extracellular repeat protein